MNQLIKYIVIISPPILLIILFHIYWYTYVTLYNQTQELTHGIPYSIYWSYIIMIAVGYTLFASINFYRKKHLWTLRMHFQNKILLRNMLFTYIAMLLIGNAMFVLRHLKSIERNVSLHTIVLIFISVFIVKSLVFKFSKSAELL